MLLTPSTYFSCLCSGLSSPQPLIKPSVFSAPAVLPSAVVRCYHQTVRQYVFKMPGCGSALGRSEQLSWFSVSPKPSMLFLDPPFLS